MRRLSPSSPPALMRPAPEGRCAGSSSPPVPSQPQTLLLQCGNIHRRLEGLSPRKDLQTPQCTSAHPQPPTPSLVGLSVPVRKPLGLAMLMPDTEQKRDLPKCKQLQQRKRDKNPQPKANPLPQSLFGGEGSSACGFFHYGSDKSKTGASPRPCIYIAVCVYICVCVCPCICAIQPYGSIYSHAKGLTADRGPGPGNILAITALLLRCCGLHRPSTPPHPPPSLWLELERGIGGLPICWCLPHPQAAPFPVPPTPSALSLLASRLPSPRRITPRFCCRF